jgi:membrane-associated phospholipid phosphatase
MLRRIAWIVVCCGAVLPLSGQVGAGAGSWRTWVLKSGSEIRSVPPPPAAVTPAEVAQLKQYIADTRTSPDQMKQMRIWMAGPPSYRWVEQMLTLIETRGFSNPKNARNFALLNVAMYDATIAAWNSKYTYNRPRPSASDPSVPTAIRTPESPSYPSEHAATAAAAAAILTYLYPADAQALHDMAEEAGRAAMAAGINYQTDVIAGLELGRAVGAKVVAMAETDGSQAVWTGSVPSGAGYWVGTTPLEPLAGSWRTWVLSSGDQLRPGPPPAYNSPAQRAELDEIKNYQRTFASNAKGFYYQSLEGVFRVFYSELSRRILEYWNENPPAAARAYALAAIAHNDGSVACWDAKYTYWAARPNQVDPAIITLFPQPGHPSYPSAHGCFSGAIARVIGRLFPDFADAMEARAAEAVESRLWAGIHFRSDISVGLAIGRRVGDLVMERAATDGSLNDVK